MRMTRLLAFVVSTLLVVGCTSVDLLETGGKKRWCTQVLPVLQPYLVVPPAALPGSTPAQWQVVVLSPPLTEKAVCVRSLFGSVKLPPGMVSAAAVGSPDGGPPATSEVYRIDARYLPAGIYAIQAGNSPTSPAQLIPLGSPAFPEANLNKPQESASPPTPLPVPWACCPAISSAGPIPKPPPDGAATDAADAIHFIPRADGAVQEVIITLGTAGVWLDAAQTEVSVVAAGHALKQGPGFQIIAANGPGIGFVHLTIPHRDLLVRVVPAVRTDAYQPSGGGQSRPTRPIVAHYHQDAEPPTPSEFAAQFALQDIEIEPKPAEGEWSITMELRGPLVAIDLEQTERQSGCCVDVECAKCFVRHDDQAACSVRVETSGVDTGLNGLLTIELTSQLPRKNACAVFRAVDQQGRTISRQSLDLDRELLSKP